MHIAINATRPFPLSENKVGDKTLALVYSPKQQVTSALPINTVYIDGTSCLAFLNYGAHSPSCVQSYAGLS